MPISELFIGMHAINNSWSPQSPAHEGITDQILLQLADDGGSNIIRLPLDLSVVGPSGPPQWVVDSIGTLLQQAAAQGLKVILEPGQTPPDLLPAGAPLSQAPGTDADLEEIGRRFGELVEAVHSQYSQYAGVIAAWEVGNEPNLSFQNDGVYYGGEGDPAASRFYVVGLDNAEAYAKYLSSASNAIDQVEARLEQSITLVAAGVAHNDYAYLDRVLSTLSSLGGSVEGFSIHPYTTYDYNYQSPASSRPTEWIGNGVTDAERWDHYHNFQGAIYQMQGMLNKHGFSHSDLWLTEFGVPSYLGYRNAGEAGRIDQANWYAEAFGVLDSWGNDNLKGIIAHSVMDIRYKEENDTYNGFDQSSGNDGSSSIAEGSFGLYERSAADGAISEKPAVALFKAIVSGADFSSPEYRVISRVSTDGIDVSGWGTNGAGLTNGYIVLTHHGSDVIIGSAYDDSLFAGDGDDTVEGGAGADRIFGGRGKDVLNAGDGDDDVYGNHGDDYINAGANLNRVDGGTGFDTLVLSGAASDFTISGDGRFFTATAVTGWQSTTAINVEQVYFTVDDTALVLANGNTHVGNGGLPGSSPTPIHNPVHGTAGDDTLYGTDRKDVIYGYEGGDTIFGLDEDDRIFGGDGDDVIFPSWGANEVNAGAGADTVIIDGRESDHAISVDGLTVQVGGPGIWNLITHAEWIVFDAPEGEADTSINVEALLASTYNQITGTTGDDFIKGTSGDDWILGGEGQDTLYGGAGNDVLQGQGGAYNQVDYDGGPGDYTFVRNDNDTVAVTSAAWGADTLTDIDGVWFRGAGQWYAIADLFGSSGPGDTIAGGAGDDFLSGTSGDDTILGGDGNDTLYGYLGDDFLDGEAGSYNQVDYDGASADYLFTRESDGSVTVSHDVYGTDTLRNINGVWFYGEEQWYALDALTPTNTLQANNSENSTQGSQFQQDAGAGNANAAHKTEGSDQSGVPVFSKKDMAIVLPDGLISQKASAYYGYLSSRPYQEVRERPFEAKTNLFEVSERARLGDWFAENETDMGGLWFEPELIGDLV